jgi:uncharacterized alkaline shock family protein YloU
MRRSDVVVEGPLGRVELTSSALASLVVRAAESVPGVRVRRPRRGLEIAVDRSRAHVEIGVVGPLDGVLPEVGERVQAAIATALRETVGLEAEVDVAIEELA